MVIVADLTRDRLVLEEPDDFGRLHLEVRGRGSIRELGLLLDGRDAGRLEGAVVVVSVAWIRQQVAGRVAEHWEAGFSDMLSFAEAKGWLRDGGAGVQAHVVWSGWSGRALPS